MKTNRIIPFLLACTLSVVSMGSCSDKDTDNTISLNDNSEFLKLCTPVYKGASYVFSEKTEDLTIYLTDVKDEYYIPCFFQGNGELFFKWDKTTNTLTIEESYTGMSNGAYPVYISSQKKYEDFKGVDAQRSFYDIATGAFHFFVLMETAEDSGMIYVETNLLFEVNSRL